tara:strand:- start:738 stop:956 length:219 start_codon:yes stop_codon:yes gene_type:complete
MSQFNAFHGFGERAICSCGSTLCERIPSVGFSVSGVEKQSTKKDVPGEKVKDFIEESREELKQQRKKLEEKR